MDEGQVFAYLRKQKKAALLDCLWSAYRELNDRQRRAVFAGAVERPPRAVVDGKRLHEEIERFRRDSLAGKYYATFNVNSKNFMEIPEETADWCSSFARFVAETTSLTARGKHAPAVACFAMLYELLECVNGGKEIFYAEEAGPWMIPTNEKGWLKAYLTSLAATATPEAFAAAAAPMIRRDGRQSFASKVYASAIAAADPAQKAALKAMLRRQNIPGSARSGRGA